MSTVIKFKISPGVAAFVRAGATSEKKLAGLQSAPSLEPSEEVVLVFCLMRDADAAVKEAAVKAFADLSGERIRAYVISPDAHPFLLEELARIHYGKAEVVEALLSSDHLSESSRLLLPSRCPVAPNPVQVAAPSEDAFEHVDELPSGAEMSVELDQMDAAEGGAQEETVEIDEEAEQFLSKYKLAMSMGISEKIKMALTGDKEWRAILVKDANKLVSGSVIKNPRITDAEILNILKVGVQNDEIVRLICANREWVKNYSIRKALINCPKTPLANSLRYLSTMNEKDIAGYAKSKNIASVLSSQAKRLLLAKKR